MVGCLYISEFPAWALQRQQPEQRAVAVYHAGRIIARSRFLCQAGMLLGDPLDRARALFPEACFFDRDAPFEQAIWDGVLQRINEITPFLESLERGVAFFKPYDFSEARVLAGQLVVRVGLGPDKGIARIAAARSAPGSVLQVRDAAVARFLSRSSVAVLSELGFDENLPARLTLFGLTTLDKVRALTKRHLTVQFAAAGSALFDMLHPASGATHVPAYVPPATITESFRFDSGVCDFVHLSHLLDSMVRRAALRLGRSVCTRIALRLQFAESCLPPAFGQRALKTPTADPGVVGRAANFLLCGALTTPGEVVLIEITLAGLESARHPQASLFFERPPLKAAIQHLAERFPGAIRRAVLMRPGAPFPEDSVRLVPFVD
jgi:hypothetical protein